MELSATGTTITGPVGECLQAGTKMLWQVSHCLVYVERLSQCS